MGFRPHGWIHEGMALAPLPAAAASRPFLVVRDQEVVWLRFPARPLFIAADMVAKVQLMDTFAACAADADVRVIVLDGFPEKAGSGEYSAFFREALQEHDGKRVHRMLNAFNQLILAILGCPKLVMFVDDGPIISQFINVSLVCDYRIVGEATLIQKAYLRHGMLPKGGGTLMLERMLGRSQALKLLLSAKDVTARQALSLGLVDEVVPSEALQEAARARAEKLARVPASTVEGLKRLLTFDLTRFEQYLEFENEEILRASRRARF